ncbi:TetR/AcrR family transcriptional regulator [Streptacidiphilus sp. PB12-B1b]|uniref:TetR/AcrR family transcriptional regulator n=1 Tax=Streptacidiphilus sp. PB12-B1b TaxID=2705012 RepID=UPI0015FDCD8A|nr:TetR/AcrR family transcriptional regulator [Streptacidiphilus sp. PB12-B1b]QMU78337.1 TetR/AcrR family transcriptional regulator [Streptacidiphilus sp. PB12-B1b]
MRRSKGDKDETRQRILDSAGRLFKADGIDGTGIAGLMADAGLTNGGFYKHFSSKDDLVAHTVADQLALQQRIVDALPPGRAGVEEFVRYYLSAQHRDGQSDGCVSAALLDEIGRCSDGVRQSYTQGLTLLMEEIARRLTPADPAASRTAVTTAFAMMAGSIQISRALADRAMADELLDNAATTALALFETAASAVPAPAASDTPAR